MKKYFILLGTVTMLAMLLTGEMIGIQKVEAAEMQNVYTMESNEGIVPYADVIVTKYRWNNGVLECRRWNETKGRWEDSDWIPMP